MRTLMIHILLLASLLGRGTAPVYAAADSSASPATKNLLTYLTNLPNQASHRLISGQWGGWNGMSSTSLARQERIYALTGHYPGLWGISAWKTASSPTILPFTLTASNISNMIAWWNNGGLIEVDGMFPNPETGSDFSDSKITGNYADIYTDNGNALNVAYNASLDQLAGRLQMLEDAGVVVLFRPLHEMNSPYFWWGASGSSTQYIALWQYTFNYLTATKDLHNLLFVFAPWYQSSSSVMSMYPGDAFVDIVGIDAYNYKAGGKLFNYDELVATGKPFALTEFGVPHYGKDSPEDLNEAIQQIKTHMPRAVYFMAWNENWAIDFQTNARAALNDPWVQNRCTPPQSIP
jgi:mannan endo-1,4-beta-mannosidase